MRAPRQALSSLFPNVVNEKLVLKDFSQYAKLVTDAYEKAPTNEPAALPHWTALQASTEKLFKRISSKVKVEFVDENPYADAAQMKAEVNKTSVLKIWTGESDHAIFGQEGNLHFRAVHDYITHILCGQPFGLKGELRAYNTHAKMASPAAVPALFTEVVGQACVAVTSGGFPAQKIAVLRGFDYYRIGMVADHEVENKELKPKPFGQQPEPKPAGAPAAKKKLPYDDQPPADAGIMATDLAN